DAPAHELGGQAYVLPLLADGERKLRIVHHHFQMFLECIDHGDTADLRRTESIGRHLDGIFRVLDDIDLLAAQLADDGLHAHAFHADAGAHAVHVAVARQYSDLGALAGLARARLDGHRTVVNFRHFLLEEAHDELRRAARHHHPRATAEFIHVLDHTADSVAGSEALRPP